MLGISEGFLKIIVDKLLLIVPQPFVNLLDILVVRGFRSHQRQLFRQLTHLTIKIQDLFSLDDKLRVLSLFSRLEILGALRQLDNSIVLLPALLDTRVFELEGLPQEVFDIRQGFHDF